MKHFKELIRAEFQNTISERDGDECKTSIEINTLEFDISGVVTSSWHYVQGGEPDEISTEPNDDAYFVGQVFTEDEIIDLEFEI